MANNFSLIEKYNHLTYIFDKNLFGQKEKIWPESQVIGGIEDYEEELYFPSKNYILIENEFNKLKAFYGSKNNEVEKRGRKYGRLLTSDGHIISSIFNHRTEHFSRKNHYVEFRRTIDKYSHLKNDDPELMLTKAYGKVEYFFTHKHQNKTKFLAFIQLTSRLIEDTNLEIKYFTKFTSQLINLLMCV
nr:1333_t:CDS:2 [Entrophospora candida]